VQLLRGDPQGPTRVADMLAAISDALGTDVAASASDITGWQHLAAGHFAEARDAWLAQGDESDTNAPFAYPRAGKSALLARDASGAQDALDRLALNGTRGRVVDVERATIEAGIAALEGRTSDALAGYRRALSLWGDLGAPWDQAWSTWTAAITLGPEVPEVRAWGAAAVAVLEQLRAAPIVALLEHALGGPGAVARQPAASSDGTSAGSDGTGAGEVAERA
jgi:hypothetical protein